MSDSSSLSLRADRLRVYRTLKKKATLFEKVPPSPGYVSNLLCVTPSCRSPFTSSRDGDADVFYVRVDDAPATHGAGAHVAVWLHCRAAVTVLPSETILPQHSKASMTVASSFLIIYRVLLAKFES